MKMDLGGPVLLGYRKVPFHSGFIIFLLLTPSLSVLPGELYLAQLAL